MKIVSLSIVLSTLLLAGCGSGKSASDQDAAAVTAQIAANKMKPVPTAEECQAKATDAARSDCMYDRMVRTPLKSEHSHVAPVVDPLLGKPIGDADPSPATASSSTR